ncbi:MAG: insulinase family protein [Alphaproteobacteria bacterium]|nr:insulinase family protein [Alphaproteobacteria bacterium]
MTVRVTTLPTGLRVVTDTMESIESATFGAWVSVGTRHEDARHNGVSHLLEHMAFKGTRRRTARRISEEIDAVGGTLNAFTMREYTAYYAKVLHGDIALAVDLIADILQESIFDPAELERERTVILQEIGHALDTPDDVLFDRFQAAAYPDQPLGWPVLGSAEKIRAMPREAIVDYMRGHYSAPNMIVTAAGRVDHDRLVDLVGRAFARLPAPQPRPSAAAALYRGGVDVRNEKLEQVHLALGFEGVSALDDDLYPAAVFSMLFGGGASSRLYQEVRESRGLVYSIYSYLSPYVDGGVFGIYAGIGENDAGEALAVIADQALIVAETMSEEEVARAKALLKASTLMGLESTMTRCDQAARDLVLFGRPIPATEIVARIDAVDRAAVARMARKLTASTPTLVALGPVGRVGDYEKLKERLRA